MTDRDEAFVRRFLKLSDAVEKRLVRFILAALALIVLVQGLLAIDAARERLTGIDRMEGRTYSFARPPDRMLY